MLPRKIKCHFLISLILLLGSRVVYGDPILIICIPGSSQIIKIQRGYDELLGMGKAVAFGRIRDFEAMVSSTSEAAIIVPGTCAETMSNYKIVLRGKVDKSTHQKYLVVAATPDITRQNMTEKTFGILNFLGRGKLDGFIHETYGFSPKIIKHTYKRADLLNMLRVECVDALFVSESEYNEISSATKIRLVTVMTTPKTIPYTVFAVPVDRKHEALCKVIMEQPVSLVHSLDIEEWGKE
jgi:hypothetical protein